MDIASIFPPEDFVVFVNEALGRHAMHVEGGPEKFRDLMSWPRINLLLAYGGLAHPRLRLIVGDREVPPNAYSRSGRSGYPRLLVSEMTALIRGGAMLAIDAIDELEVSISSLCRALEMHLGLPVDAELYATCLDGDVRPA